MQTTIAPAAKMPPATRRWSSGFRPDEIAIALCNFKFNPFQAQIGARIVRNGEWWDLYYKAKTEYDLMRGHATINCDPCIPAVRWDGSQMTSRQRAEPIA
jgi:hypothetical protein